MDNGVGRPDSPRPGIAKEHVAVTGRAQDVCEAPFAIGRGDADRQWTLSKALLKRVHGRALDGLAVGVGQTPSELYALSVRGDKVRVQACAPILRGALRLTHHQHTLRESGVAQV